MVILEKELEKDIISDISSLDNITENVVDINNGESNISQIEDLDITNSQKVEPVNKPKKKRNCKTSKKDKEKLVLEKMCIICGKVNTPGIVIMDKKICSCCEEKAVKADIKSEFYEDYKNKISKNVVGKLKNLG